VLDCKPLKGPNTTFWKIYKENKLVGKVTSAVYSPRLKKNIALAMISIDLIEIGTIVDIETPYSIIKGTVVNKPFYDPKKKITTAKI
jgi:Glycine cleavage system T protein (aminomethyltransferase)